jgi:hypothetical protein
MLFSRLQGYLGPAREILVVPPICACESTRRGDQALEL